MTATSSSSTSGKTGSGTTPFDAIRTAENTAQQKIDAEEAKLRKETDDAMARNAKYLEDKRAEMTEKAKSELKDQKNTMATIIGEAEKEAQRECNELKTKAQANMPRVLGMLKEKFLSLRA